MGLGNFIGDVTDMFYKPQVNPALLNGDATHYDPTTGAFAKQDPETGEMTPIPMYQEPNWFERGFSPMAKNIMMQNAVSEVAPLQAQQNRNIQRTIAGQDASTIPTSMLPYGNDMQANITGIVNPRLNPAELNPQVQAASFAGTGAPATIGTLGGQSGIATAQQMLQEAQAGLRRQDVITAAQDAEAVNRLSTSTGVEPLVIKNQLNQLRGDLRRDPTYQQLQDRLLDIQNTGSKFTQAEQGLKQHIERLGDVATDRNLSIMPTPGTGIPFATHVGVNGTEDYGGLNPTYANMMRMMNAKMGVAGGGIAGPSGGSMPPRNIATPAGSYTPGMIGDTGGREVPPDYLNNAMKYEPLGSNPDILVNPETQRAIYKPTGQDITEQINSNPALTHQIAQELRDKQDKEKSDNEKVLKAQHVLQMKSFRDKQDALVKAKQYGGLIGVGRDAYNSFAPPIFSQLLGLPPGISPIDVYHGAQQLNDYTGNKVHSALIGD